ncbi:adventurous gliding motility protein AgmC [Archangium lansingense]|uniref:Hemagglutinin n=1 Tax=Archangium lansingense TaxID=2995310 RepID=A0ABT4AQ56_9BACT|nr:hemagglutinin [Archangium lansinium]MCY1082912.1 hemagglutinin [Archangium lansinium]
MPPSVSRRFVPGLVRGFSIGLVALVLGLMPAAVRAEADTFGLGNGQHGSLQVKDSGVIINDSTALTAEVPEGATELPVADASAFAAGELVLVLQVGDEQPLDAFRAAVDELDARDSGAGRWELARLTEVVPGVLSLSAPLVNRYAAVSQVVRVPEYTDVRVLSSGSLRTRPWDGRSGGVLAFLATGTVFNQGTMEVEGAGFRGGAAEVGEAAALYDCMAQDGSASNGGGARKGEGLAGRREGMPRHGYGRLSNGGGGGNCHDAGGGGGGHVGQGGQGARSSQEVMERDVGGRGGSALSYERTQERLLLGGGGGAGIEGTDGGAGGGILFVRAREIQSPRPRGIITANGLGAASASSIHGGGGGGGAGGTVHVRVAEQFGCTVLSANGGVGADSDVSPGGGGGGGLLFIQAVGGVPSECTASVSAGLSGYSFAGARGAEPVAAGAPLYEGRLDVLALAFAAPTVPTWVSPGAGEEHVAAMPRIEGRTAPGATVQVFLDGEPLGEPVVADESGTFALVPPTALGDGPHEASAWAEQFGLRSASSEPLGFTVGGALVLLVGCGCGSSPGSGAWGLGLAVLALVLRGARRGTERG